MKKVWLITGCSTGFGHALSKQVINAGHKVVVTARNIETLEPLKALNPENVLTLKLDVLIQDDIDKAVSQAIETFGRIDILVNNAGIGYFASVEESIEEEVQKMFNINFWGLMHVTKAVLPHMRAQKSGHIINLSSVGGLVSFPALGYYHATKYAVEGITETLSQEIAPFNIKTTLIEPGGYNTDWGGRSSVKTESDIYTQSVGPMIEAMKNSAGSGGDPDEVASAIMKVASSENPPLRLLVGQGSSDAIKNKYSKHLASIEAWENN